MSSSRASLLAGLRTGGVRSVSGSSAAIPRLHHPEDHLDQLSGPFTAALDGPNFVQHQNRLNPNSAPFTPTFYPAPQLQALQMQMMQLEIMRLQNIQAQHYQTEILAQQQQQQQQPRQQPVAPQRTNPAFNVPASASPANGSFSATQSRRPNHAEMLRAQLGLRSDDQIPMTAALGGKFGSRTASAHLPRLANMSLDEYEEAPVSVSSTPASTTVISGGISLGNGTALSAPLSKSDSATSWRRGGNNHSVLTTTHRSVTSPRVKVTPPPEERVSPERNSPSPPALAPIKSRPVPLRFSSAAAQMLPAVAIDTSPFESGDAINSARADDGYSTASSNSASSPPTPRSTSSNEHMPLSPREEASKKLYEGLGIGRPAPAFAVADTRTPPPPPIAVISHRVVSQPMRQPRGPPSGTDELAPQNFASRIRRKAIGGLGAALMSARERREVVEAY